MDDSGNAAYNKGMQRTRNQRVSHARLVAGGGSCAPLMPSVGPHSHSMFRYNPAAHSDQDNLRWCWLRAVEWGDWPLFIAQPIAPILLAFGFNYFVVAGVIVALTYIWATVRYKFVSPWLADVGSDLVHLKWPISLLCAWLLWRRGATVPAVLAGAWPLVTLMLGIITPPTKIGVIQRSLMLSLGYTRLDELDQAQGS